MHIDFSAITDRKLVRAAGGSNRYVLARFTAPENRSAKARPPVNVAFVLDRSGSMAGSKLELVKEATRQAIRLLRDTDRFAVVFFDSEVHVAVASTYASRDAKRAAVRMVDGVEAGANTALFDGWVAGCEQVASFQDERAISRVVLLTDGVANVGITDMAELSRHAGELRSRGISTTTLGAGKDFDEIRLQSMADAGGGNFYFIEHAAGIPDVITSELRETLEVVARDVVINVTTTPDVLVEPLSVIRHAGSNGQWQLNVGDVVSGQDVSVVFRLIFPSSELGESRRAVVTLLDRERVLEAEEQNLEWVFQAHHANDVQERDPIVDREVAVLLAARAKHEAVQLNRQGDFVAAASSLNSVRERIRSYAGSDPEMRVVLTDLSQTARELGRQVDAMTLKRHHFASSAPLRMRTSEGKARRRS